MSRVLFYGFPFHSRSQWLQNFIWGANQRMNDWALQIYKKKIKIGWGISDIFLHYTVYRHSKIINKIFKKKKLKHLLYNIKINLVYFEGAGKPI